MTQPLKSGNSSIGGSPVEAQLMSLLPYAVMAPSSHNSQPWLFRIANHALEILADRSRALPVSDPDGRELTISCGAAFAHAVLAARHMGYAIEEDYLPKRGDPDLLGRLRLTGRLGATPALERRFAAIPHRRTTRTSFAANGLEDRLSRDLVSIAAAHGIQATIYVDARQREAIAKLVARADRRQMGNPNFRSELAHWMRRRSNDAQDGMSIASFGVSDILSPAAAALIRTFDMGASIAASDYQLAAGSPVLLLLSTESDNPQSWMTTGAALSDILLEATANDASTAYLNQPLELPDMRAELRGLLGIQGHPQVLVRLGRGQAVAASPRREAVLVS